MSSPEDYLEKTSFLDQLIGGHREWLLSFGLKYRDKWDNLFYNCPEAALCEAAVRDVLESFLIDVEPFDDLGNSQKPDFKCVKDDYLFFVEATCVTQEVATRKTGLEHVPHNDEASCYALLTQTFFQEICNKVPQCSNLNAPCLIAIGTWHLSAGCLCFNKRSAEEILTSSSQISVPINTKTGKQCGGVYKTTDLRWSAFVRPSNNSNNKMEFARSPISGILLCPFGGQPVQILGLLHPNPNHSFDPKILDTLPFGKLNDSFKSGCFSVDWI